MRLEALAKSQKDEVTKLWTEMRAIQKSLKEKANASAVQHALGKKVDMTTLNDVIKNEIKTKADSIWVGEQLRSKADAMVVKDMQVDLRSKVSLQEFGGALELKVNTEVFRDEIDKLALQLKSKADTEVLQMFVSVMVTIS